MPPPGFAIALALLGISFAVPSIIHIVNGIRARPIEDPERLPLSIDSAFYGVTDAKSRPVADRLPIHCQSVSVPVSTRTFPDYYPLGGHLKTGHTWPLQNRPTKLSQDKSIYNPRWPFRQTLFRNLVRRAYTGEAWTEDTATLGSDQSADPGPEWRAAQAAPPRSPSGGKAVNPGSARAEPSH